MSTLPVFPNKRIEVDGLGNPRFVSDIVNANEQTFELARNILGLGLTDFAIISGLDYTPGAPGSYGAGVVYMNGKFYRTTGLAENKYLQGVETNVFTKIFSDGASREIYTQYSATQSNTVWGAMPVFSGNMNTYRLSIKRLAANVLQLDNTTSYTPTASTHPATKGYSEYYTDWYAKGILKVSGPHTIASSDDITITLPENSVIVNMKGTRGGGNWLFSFGYNSSVQDISVQATSSTQYNLYNATGGEITALNIYYMVWASQPSL